MTTLPIFIDDYELEDPEVGQAFQEVLRRIPESDVGEFPGVEVFTVPHTVEGANVRRYLGSWQIWLCPETLKKKVGGDRAALRGLLAHEIAHAFLRHDAEKPGNDELREEAEADEKAREWVGEDVDTFRHRCGPPTLQPLR